MYHNKLKSIQRVSLTNETVIDRLIISINGIGTAIKLRSQTSCFCFLAQKRIAAIQSHKLISFEIFFRVNSSV